MNKPKKVRSRWYMAFLHCLTSGFAYPFIFLLIGGIINYIILGDKLSDPSQININDILITYFISGIMFLVGIFSVG